MTFTSYVFLLKNLSRKVYSDPSDNDIESLTTTITSPEKRHLGSLARSGWMSSLRPVRNRFSRSGRTETGRTENTDGILNVKTFLLKREIFIRFFFVF